MTDKVISIFEQLDVIPTKLIIARIEDLEVSEPDSEELTELLGLMDFLNRESASSVTTILWRGKHYSSAGVMSERELIKRFAQATTEE